MVDASIGLFHQGEFLPSFRFYMRMTKKEKSSVPNWRCR